MLCKSPCIHDNHLFNIQCYFFVKQITKMKREELFDASRGKMTLLCIQPHEQTRYSGQLFPLRLSPTSYCSSDPFTCSTYTYPQSHTYSVYSVYSLLTSSIPFISPHGGRCRCRIFILMVTNIILFLHTYTYNPVSVHNTRLAKCTGLFTIN